MKDWRVVVAESGAPEIAILMNMPSRVLPDQRQITLAPRGQLTRIERALRGHRMRVTGIEERQTSIEYCGRYYPLVVVNVKEN